MERASLGVVAVILSATSAPAQVVLPNECETTTSRLMPLAAYFGGVSAYGTEVSPALLHSGNSLRCWANFRHDSFFTVAGFTVGATQMVRPALTTPPDPAFFSLAVRTPDLQGKRVRLRLIIREDDNNDGVLDAGADDDEWEANVTLAQPGTQMLNVPVASFADNNPLTGNDTRQFGTINRIALNITFETRQNLPGGIIEFPVSFYVDHVGFYDLAQALPINCAANFDGAGGVTVGDIFAFLSAWFAGSPSADFDGAAGVGVADIFAFLSAWFAGC